MRKTEALVSAEQLNRQNLPNTCERNCNCCCYDEDSESIISSSCCAYTINDNTAGRSVESLINQTQVSDHLNNSS